MNKRQKLSILQLEDLPDEILLKIFKNLEVKDILRCGQMSKRIRAISTDESLWEKINLRLVSFRLLKSCTLVTAININ